LRVLHGSPQRVRFESMNTLKFELFLNLQALRPTYLPNYLLRESKFVIMVTTISLSWYFLYFLPTVVINQSIINKLII